MRKVLDAKDITTNEKIYFKGHAKATYMSDGRNVEDTINEVNTKMAEPISWDDVAPEVKDKIENAGGGADWNAKGGEAGYINNRTHYYDSSRLYSFDVSNADITYDDNGNISKVIFHNITYSDIGFFVVNTDHLIGGYSLSDSMLLQKTDINSIHNGYFSSYLKENDDYLYDLVCVDFVGDPIDQVFNAIKYTNCIEEFLTTLDESYIPDTIARKSEVYEENGYLWDEIDTLWENLVSVDQSIDGKQNKLVSGTNIKTINGDSILGSGNIEIKSEIPDWNAKEGEAGYIENRTHHAWFSRIEFDEENNKGKYEVVGFVDKLLLLFRDRYFTVYKNITLNIDVDGGEDTFIVNYNGVTLFIIDNYGHLKNEYENILVSEDITPLTDIFIPNTVLKTTPQTLSDTDKNQVLTNLGIDPVVWKYICNPCIIKNGDKVPEELIGKYADEVGSNGGYYLKYLNLAMYKIMIDHNIDLEYGAGASVIITPSGINKYGANIDNIYISKDHGVFAGSAYIDENKNWMIE